MNLFKSFTMKWWQIGLFKVGLLALGALAGAYWPGLFQSLTALLALIAAGALGYIGYIWLKQID